MKIKLDIEPAPMPRPVTVVKHGKVWSFIPNEAKKIKAEMVYQIRPQLTRVYPEHTPVKLTITFYRHRPVSIPSNEDIPVRKPDLDNYVKMCVDSLTEAGLYPDDAQVSNCQSIKRWSINGQGYITIDIEDDTLDAT